MRFGIGLTAGLLVLGSLCGVPAMAQSDRPAPGGTDAPPPAPPPRRDRPDADRPMSRSDEINIVLRRHGDGPFEMYVNGELISGPARERFWRALLGPDLARGLRGLRPDQADGSAGDAGAPPGNDRRGNGGPVRDQQGGDLGSRSFFPGRPPWMGEGGWRNQNVEMTDERVKEMLEVIGDFDKPLHDRLEAELKTNPEGVRDQLRRENRVWAMAIEMRKRDPARYELSVQERKIGREVGELIPQYQAARETGDETASEDLRAQLRDRVAAQYEVREKIREHDLDALEARLVELREQVAQRKQQREQIVDKYLEYLLERGRGDTDRRHPPGP